MSIGYILEVLLLTYIVDVHYVDSHGLQKLFKYLECYHHRGKCLEPFEIKKCAKNCYSEPTETLEISEFSSVFGALFDFKLV